MTLFQAAKKIFYWVAVRPYNKMRFGQFGKDTMVLSSVKIDGSRRIFIGNNVIVSSFGWLAAVPHTGNKNCKLIVGNGTYIGRFCHIYSTSNITIGDKVLIGDKVYISDNLHGYQDVEKPIIDQALVQGNDVSIGDGSWLGENVSVIGASIGKQSIVGANAVVTKNIPDYCVAIGVPAKIVKRYNFHSKIWEKTNELGEFI
jgi:acetyltransferase-like isoleucine patch superfamily enzyme